jgi:hypothetical protein
MPTLLSLKTNFTSLPEADAFILVKRLRHERQVYIEDVLTAKKRQQKADIEEKAVGVVKAKQAGTPAEKKVNDKAKMKALLATMSPEQQLELLKRLARQ